MGKIAELLPLLEDMSLYEKAGVTNGDSSMGFYDSPEGVRVIIKKSKKSDPEAKFENESDREQAILNDLGSEYLVSLIANKLPLESAEYKLAKKDGVFYFVVIASKSFLQEKSLSLKHASHMFDEQYPNPLKPHTDMIHKKEVVFFTLDVVLKTIETYIKRRFPNVKDETIKSIKVGFLKICFLDALVGNQDRHVENWGVVHKELDSSVAPKICPVYDTARAFMWNVPDSKLKDKDVSKYCNDGQSFLGLSLGNKISHFTFVEEVIKKYPEIKPEFESMLTAAKNINLDEMLSQELFLKTFIPARHDKIKEIWKYRLEKLESILKNN